MMTAVMTKVEIAALRVWTAVIAAANAMATAVATAMDVRMVTATTMAALREMALAMQ